MSSGRDGGKHANCRPATRPDRRSRPGIYALSIREARLRVHRCLHRRAQSDQNVVARRRVDSGVAWFASNRHDGALCGAAVGRSSDGMSAGIP